MIEILIILIAVITIYVVIASCKIAKKADKNAQIILKKYKSKTKKLD